MTTKVLTEAELRAAVGLDAEALATVEEGFAHLGRGAVTMPPIQRIDVPEHEGEVDVKSAYVRGWDAFAVKLSSGFFKNPRRGLPTGSGLMVLLSAETGVPQAVLLDNGYLTDVRTALAGAVAAKHLAPAEVGAVGIVGAGAQARHQAEALRLVRDYRRLLVWARRPEEARAYAEEVGPRLGVEVEVSPDVPSLARASDLVVTTTPATEPVLTADALHPGLHVTAMGSDAEHKNELDPQVLARATARFCDSRAQCARLGELRSAHAAGVLAEDARVPELGEVVAGSAAGRSGPEEITVCDLTGTGVQDTAIARYALRRASEAQAGTDV